MAAAWIVESSKYYGFTETSNRDQIVGWANFLGPKSFSDTFEPNGNVSDWCGVFAGICMKKAGIAIPANYQDPSAWLNFGDALPVPVEGCVGVFQKFVGQKLVYHVGFIMGVTDQGHYVLRGGNQNNRVYDSVFAKPRLVQCRWPSKTARPDTFMKKLVLPDMAFCKTED